MKNKRKQISNEISIRILSVVITIFVIFSIVVAIMIGNISLSSQKDELELQSKAASYQLETFFKKYTTTAEQMALNPDIREILKLNPAIPLKKPPFIRMYLKSCRVIRQQTVKTFLLPGSVILMLML